MKHSLIRLSTLALILLALASCAQQDLGISTMVPDSALGFVQITDPDKFITNIDAFSQPLGVTKMTGNLGVKDLLSMGLKSGANLEISSLNLKKPLGIAVLPPLKDSADFRYIIYVPVEKIAENAPKLNKLFEALPDVSAATANGYCIYYTGTEKLTFPPAKALRIPENLVFESGALTMYLDITSTLVRYKDELATIKQSALAEIEQTESAAKELSNPSLGAASNRIVNGLFEILEQTKSYALTLRADAVGLKLSSLVNFSANGSVSKILKDIGPGADLQSQVKYLPANCLLLSALSGNASAFKDLYKEFMAMYLNALKSDDVSKTAITKMIDDTFTVMGKKAAFGLDLKLDPRIQAISPEMLNSNFADLFTINLVSVNEVTNGEAYTKLLTDLVSGGTMKQYLDTMLAATGFSLTLNMVDQKDGDFSWKELKYDLQVVDPDKIDLDSDSARKAAGMMAGIFQKLNLNLCIKGNKVFMVMGENAVDNLKKIVKNDRVENSVEKNEAWKNYLKTVPADAQYVGNVSVGKIVDLANVASGNSLPIELAEADRSGIFSYARLSPTAIEASSFWDIKEIAPISKFVTAQMGNLFGH